MSKLVGILFGAAIAAFGAWRIDATEARICWVIAVAAVTALAVFVRHGPARRPLLKLGITIVLIVIAFVSTLLGDDRPQLGLDLQGGVSIVLFPVEGSDLSQLNTATNIISNRINGLGVAEPEVNRQGNTIVVDIPGLKDPNRAMEVVGRTACLRFRLASGAISATEVVGEPAPSTTTSAGATTTTSASATTAGVGTDTTADAAGRTITTRPVVANRPAQASTSTSTASTSPSTTTTTVGGGGGFECEATPSEPTLPDTSTPDTPVPETTVPETTATGGTTSSSDGSSSSSAPSETSAEAAGRTITTRPVAAARPAQAATTTVPTTTVPTSTTGSAATTTTTTTPGATTTSGPATTTTTLAPGTPICETLVGADDPNSTVFLWDANKENCYSVGPTILTGEAIRTAQAAYENQWVVNVEFRNDDFVTLIAQPYVGQQVAIVLDDRVQSAPTINQGITGRDVQITGPPFKESDARDLALVLRYGSLPIQFDENETTRQSVSPSLGKDQLRAGIAAGIMGLALVAIYMMAFYRLLGLVVWLGLGLTGLIFFALVTFLGDSSGLTLTLSGVTGLIVSVGVTVDSYVVYFERLKDEVRSGKTIRSSLDAGFTRAFRTIVAADLVSLIGAAVLYLLAVGSVRGFAFFLGLSTLIDLVLAYFLMHPLVWFLARRPALVRMKGMGIASGLDVADRASIV